MTNKVSLSTEQLEALNNGNKVMVETNYAHTDIELHPPCEGDHDWYRHSIDTHNTGDGKAELSRRCRVCGTRDTVECVPDHLFKEEVKD